MKVIDLLNKIANGEEVPKKIKYNGKIYFYHKGYDFDYAYTTDEGGYLIENKSLFQFSSYKDNCWNDNSMIDFLNNEVEIIEEPQEHKIPEKLEDISEIKCVGCKVEINIAGNKTLFDTDTPIVTEHCIYKINQLIKNQKKILDYLEVNNGIMD